MFLKKLFLLFVNNIIIIPVVIIPYAIINPFTMMVKIFHTSLASTTMFSIFPSK